MNKIVLVIGLSFIGFFVVLAGFIGSRLDSQTVTVLASLTCGFGVAAPIGAAIGWTLRGRRETDRGTAQSPQQPIVMMTQPQLPQQASQPNYATQSMNNSWGGTYPQMPAPRQFTIVGEEPTQNESESIW